MKVFASLAAALLLCVTHAAHAGVTLDAVKKKGFVQCGVSTGVAGFSNPDSKGVWTGLDVDLCKAVAATVFGDAGKFKLTPLNTQQRFTALQSGEVDVLPRNTSITLQRDAGLGLEGAGINFYDGQGVMVAKKLGVKSVKELDGATICLQPGTTTELNLAGWFRANHLKFTPVVINDFNEVVRAFTAGRCDAYTTDISALAGIRVSKLPKPDDYVVLPDALSKEPLGPMVRQGDPQWSAIVRWTLQAMIEAEEYGITSQNVDQMARSTNPDIQRILGVTPGLGKALGVDEKWVYNIVKQVGNYGESFERNLGQGSPIKLERASNALWTKGGLMYALPLR
jgi:general L-amino acid transport system substrate-binding protein